MDIETLKEEVSILDILAYYDGDTPLRSGWVSVRCPFHGDNRPSASVNADEGRFYCFTCDVHGDILDVVQQVESIESVKEAITWITETFIA